MEQGLEIVIVRLADGLEPRDINTKTPFDLPGKLNIADARRHAHAILHMRSTLDQAIDVQMRGMVGQELAGRLDTMQRIGFDVGQEVYLAAGNTTTQRDAYSVSPAQMMPEMYLEVTAKDVPTSGAFDAWLILLWPTGGPQYAKIT